MPIYSSMRPSKTLELIACYLFVSPASCYTYWIHSTCFERAPIDTWDKYMKETFSLAASAATHLGSDTDTDFAAVFKRIFKVDKLDDRKINNVFASIVKDEKNPPPPKTPRDFVYDIMQSIGNDWISVTGGTEQQRLDSNVRIYCDNDDRWVPHPRSPERYAWDPENAMMVKLDKYPQPLCQIKGDLLAQVYYRRIENTDDRPIQNEFRNTITICDRAVSRVPDTIPLGFAEIPKGFDLREIGKFGEGISNFRFTFPALLVHEFSHVYPYRTSDVKYGWSDMMEITGDPQVMAEKTVNNADSYFYLALFAGLADFTLASGSGGYTLPRLIPRVTRANSAEAEQAEKDANAGVFVAYPNITKRWLSLIARFFKA